MMVNQSYNAGAGAQMADRLTPKQKTLLADIETICNVVRVDYWNIRQRERKSRTAVLEVMKRELVRGEIIGQYTLIDDILATELCAYFLPGKDLIAQWKTKRFRRFNYFVIERLYLTQKLAFLKDVYVVPKRISSTIEEINALRNAMAHAFFPENLRAYQMKGRPSPRKPVAVLYRGADIFSIAGAKKMVEDCAEVVHYLSHSLTRKSDTAVPFLL
jgi:hypothetical protein